MTLNKTPAEWLAVKPNAVMGGSRAQGENVLAMALHDVHCMGQEIDRLRGLFNSILMLNVENPYSAQGNEMANALARSALSK